MSATDNAVMRLRAAMLDLTQAGRHHEANEVLAIIEALTPRSEPGPFPASVPATRYQTVAPVDIDCANCGATMAAHCTVHLLPCCPGSLWHGGDEGAWTPPAETTL